MAPSTSFNVILCRNVMNLFFQTLAAARPTLLYEESGDVRAVLDWEAKESLQFMPHEKQYEQLEPGCKLYRRIG